LIILYIIFQSPFLSAQNTKDSKLLEVVGSVMDKLGSPIKGAMIFADSINTYTKTDKKGFYEIEIDSTTRILSVYSKEYGLLNMKYSGQKKVSFLYKDDSKPLKKSALSSMGFQIRKKTPSNTGYEDFATILEILDKRFYYAKVTDGQVKIGKGINQFGGDTTPLLLVDNQQMPISMLSSIPTTDVKSIRVIHQGSEAAEYGGLRAANGVILITLKVK